MKVKTSLNRIFTVDCETAREAIKKTKERLRDFEKIISVYPDEKSKIKKTSV